MMSLDQAVERTKLPIVVRANLRYLTGLGKHKVSIWVKGSADWRNTSSPKRASRYYLEAVAAYLPSIPERGLITDRVV